MQYKHHNIDRETSNVELNRAQAGKEKNPFARLLKPRENAEPELYRPEGKIDFRKVRLFNRPTWDTEHIERVSPGHDEEMQEQLELWKQNFRDECVIGSAIDEDLFEASALFAYEKFTIRKAINSREWDSDMEMALLLDHNGSVWQVKPHATLIDKNGKAIKYLAAKNAGRYVLLPMVLPRQIEKINNRFNTNFDTSNPAQFWVQYLKCPFVPLIITEGWKKALCAISHGFVAVSLFGVTCGDKATGYDRDEREVVEGLKSLVAQKRMVILAFDRDPLSKPSAIKNVERALNRLAISLQNEGADVRIAEWDRDFAKGLDDVIAKEGGLQVFESAFDNALPYDQYKEQIVPEPKPEPLTYRPHTVIDKGFFTDAGITQLTEKLTGLKGSKGTGKTEFTKASIQAAKRRVQKVIFITYREQLVRDYCGRTGSISIYDVMDAGGWASDVGQKAQAEGFAFCIDSAHPDSQAKFNPDDYKDALVIIDEVEQMLHHMVLSSTCKKMRGPIIKTFQKICQNALSEETDGMMLIADADLSDRSINYIKEFAGREELEPCIIVNNWRPTSSRKVYLYKSREHLIATMMQDAVEKKRYMLVRDAQKCKSNFSAQQAMDLIKFNSPDSKCTTVDSDVLSDGSHPLNQPGVDVSAFAAQYDHLGYTASWGTGVSVDLKGHFQKVYGVFSAVMSVGMASQALHRLRDDVDFHIYAADNGLNYIGGGYITDPKKLLQANDDLFKIVEGVNNEHEFEEAAECMKIARRLKAEFGAVQNAEMHDYKKHLAMKLSDEGYEIVEVAESEDKPLLDQTAEDVRDIRWQSVFNHCNIIASARDLSQREFLDMDAQHKRSNRSDEHAYQKHLIKERYKMGTVSRDLVEFDLNGGQQITQTRFYLTDVGRKVLARNNKHKLNILAADDLLDKEDLIEESIPVIKNVILTGLRVMDLFKYLVSAGEITNKDDRIKSLLNKAMQIDHKVLKRVGLEISKKPITFVNRLLRTIGYELVDTGRKVGGRNDQSKVFELVTLNSPFYAKDKIKDIGWEAVAAMVKHWEAQFQAEAEKLSK